ncbi:MAG: ankyrin repeat domain-containing protein [Ignavibacteria bacterium]|nr:ankyrin repeat domain-containing protein [Ignavibacteria bacterium]
MDSSLLLVSTWDLEVLTQDQLVEILRKEVRLSNPNLSLLNNLFAAGIPVNYVSLDHIVIDAAIYSTRKCLKILIDCAMNVDSASYCGETPIIAATKHNRYAIVKQLVEMGANIGARDTQDEPHCIMQFWARGDG